MIFLIFPKPWTDDLVVFTISRIRKKSIPRPSSAAADDIASHTRLTVNPKNNKDRMRTSFISKRWFNERSTASHGNYFGKTVCRDGDSTCPPATVCRRDERVADEEIHRFSRHEKIDRLVIFSSSTSRIWNIFTEILFAVLPILRKNLRK